MFSDRLHLFFYQTYFFLSVAALPLLSAERITNWRYCWCLSAADRKIQRIVVAGIIFILNWDVTRFREFLNSFWMTEIKERLKPVTVEKSCSSFSALILSPSFLPLLPLSAFIIHKAWRQNWVIVELLPGLVDDYITLTSLLISLICLACVANTLPQLLGLWRWSTLYCI